MQWKKTEKELPPHAKVVLCWARRNDSDNIGFYLGGLDYKQGWLEWPGLEYLEVDYWAEIDGPKSENEHLYVMDDAEDAMD